METLVRRIEQAGMVLAVLCLLLIMLIVSYDALSRYAFNAPLPWAFELVTYYLMVVAVYLAVSSTFSHGDHVNINLFQVMMPRRMRARVECGWSLMAAAVFAIIAQGTWENAMGGLRRNEFLPGIIVWPAWLSHLPIPIGAALAALRLALHAYTLARHGDDPAVMTEAEPME